MTKIAEHRTKGSYRIWSTAADTDMDGKPQDQMATIVAFDSDGLKTVHMDEVPAKTAIKRYLEIAARFIGTPAVIVNLFMMSKADALRQFPWYRTDQLEKALTPRNIPPEDAIAGLRGIEDAFAADVRHFWVRIGARFINRLKTEPMSGPALMFETIGGAEIAESAVVTDDTIREIWEAVIAMESEHFPLAQVTAEDEMAMRSFHRDISSSLRVQYVVGLDKLQKAVAEAAMKPTEPAELIATLDGIVESSKHVFDSIARTAATRISNAARALQWRKYADPNARAYLWIVALDDKVDERCLALAALNPWLLGDLRRESNDFAPQYGCRCVVQRIVE